MWCTPMCSLPIACQPHPALHLVHFSFPLKVTLETSPQSCCSMCTNMCQLTACKPTFTTKIYLFFRKIFLKTFMTEIFQFHYINALHHNLPNLWNQNFSFPVKTFKIVHKIVHKGTAPRAPPCDSQILVSIKVIG